MKIRKGEPFESRTLAYMLAVVAGVFLVAAFYVYRYIYYDDPHISLRYVLNLLNGDGMTWNPGERVEGYTNFLWIILVTVLAFFGMDPIVATRVLGTVSYAALFALCGRYFYKELYDAPRVKGRKASDQQDKLLVITLSMVLLISEPLVGWSLGGLEANLFALLITAGVLMVITIFHYSDPGKDTYRAFLAALLFASASLTRPEGVLFFGISGCFLAGFFLSKRQLFKNWRPDTGFYVAACFGAMFLLVIGPYLAWKYWYFGDILPNTYYVKSYGYELGNYLLIEGLRYYLAYIFSPPFIPAIMVYCAVFLSRTRAWSWPVSYIMALFVIFSVYVVQTGGDFMSHLRFLVPTIPLAALTVFFTLCTMLKNKRIQLLKDVAIVFLVAIFLQFGTLNKRGFSRGAMGGNIIADYIGDHWPRGSVVALNGVGATPYRVPDNYYIDMLGLVDKHIARRKIDKLQAPLQLAVGHLKGDGAYVLSRKPDYIIFYHSWGESAHRAPFLSGWEMKQLPEFWESYEKKQAWIDVRPSLRWMLKEEIEAQKRLSRINRARASIAQYKDGKLLFTYYQRVK